MKEKSIIHSLCIHEVTNSENRWLYNQSPGGTYACEFQYLKYYNANGGARDNFVKNHMTNVIQLLSYYSEPDK